ncbi:hypothetical protein [Methylovulum psychrotolerans]|uniref:Uncharacterized protein n=1 Tax=Methylovulum psychrotolerans TaxID=1704499 RepID=A0A2S5CFM6_9GAMM|nr:hypothetical protein [Methylovulum psychrotolerans]POZ49604.1 hypothetical protein AADEFJLK_04629 [Methylovulum psychrotolerans]
MPSKRKNNLARRARNKQNKKKRIPTFVSPILELYSNPADCEADMGLLQTAWERHYGPLSEDFVPPFYCETDDGSLQLVEWPQTFRNLLLEKYGLPELELVERRFKFLFEFFYTQAAEMAI